MDTLGRLQAVHALLDEQRRHLDKAPLTGDHETVLATAQIVDAVRRMLDELGEAVAPHARRLDPRQQRRLTSGWTFYDQDKPTTWPPPRRRLEIRCYDTADPEHPRLLDRRRGTYEGGRLTWREPGYRPLQGQPDGLPVPPGYTYSWREAQ